VRDYSRWNRALQRPEETDVVGDILYFFELFVTSVTSLHAKFVAHVANCHHAPSFISIDVPAPSHRAQEAEMRTFTAWRSSCMALTLWRMKALGEVLGLAEKCRLRQADWSPRMVDSSQEETGTDQEAFHLQIMLD
jgi:hypothetical protein